MAWYSYTIAFAISDDQAQVGADPRQILDGHKGDFEDFVYAPSRNGCLLWRLGCICEQASNGKNLYLLEDICLLQHEAMNHSATQLEALINEIKLNPALVVEATKDPYQPTITLCTEGFGPLPAQLVYPSDVIIKDGWVYNYTEQQVRHILDQSCASQTPCPEGDDDGESLSYVFNFLKSHLSLLHVALHSGKIVVYGETNH
ncbi:hypothetical protein [Synechocystis sp. PCC 6714]|uniref:hypothetical protein n=1 Tax=Synechocystis sp. (strain PCC 6714) TaxID=1147 RepID=UPI00048DC511|nr:hypothetical protein [Synechocystis sp. PCC 6714]